MNASPAEDLTARVAALERTVRRQGIALAVISLAIVALVGVLLWDRQQKRDWLEASMVHADRFIVTRADGLPRVVLGDYPHVPAGHPLQGRPGLLLFDADSDLNLALVDDRLQLFGC